MSPLILRTVFSTVPTAVAAVVRAVIRAAVRVAGNRSGTAAPMILIAVMTASSGCSFTGSASLGSGSPSAASSVTAVPGGSVATGGHRGKVVDCPGTAVIAPARAPYCYQIPTGMSDQTATVRRGSSGGQFFTAVGPGGNDLVMVQSYAQAVDTDTYRTQQLVELMAGQLSNFEAQGLVFDSKTPTSASYGGGRALVYQGKGQRPFPFASQYAFIFKGRTMVEVNCQLVGDRELLRAGCATVLTTLRIAD